MESEATPTCATFYGIFLVVPLVVQGGLGRLDKGWLVCLDNASSIIFGICASLCDQCIRLRYNTGGTVIHRIVNR